MHRVAIVSQANGRSQDLSQGHLTRPKALYRVDPRCSRARDSDAMHTQQRNLTAVCAGRYTVLCKRFQGSLSRRPSTAVEALDLLLCCIPKETKGVAANAVRAGLSDVESGRNSDGSIGSIASLLQNSNPRLRCQRL